MAGAPTPAPPAQRLVTTQPYGSRQAPAPPPPPPPSDPGDTTPGTIHAEAQPDPAQTIPRPLVFAEVLKAERASIPITPRPIVGLGSTQPMATQPLAEQPPPVTAPTRYPALPIYGVAAPPSSPTPALAPAVVTGRAATATQALAHVPTPPPPSFHAPMTPVLVDVTPRALVVETVGGWCDVVVQRNAKIPCERTRAFTTSSDMQSTVRVRVAQGEDATFGQNTYLGEVELTGLRAAPRGQVTIQVRFEVDESGTLKVFATDAATGREAHATLQLVGIAGAQSISSMAARNATMRLQ
jgi:molecular chaperone DnaK